jgi:hypothetical protein
MRVTNMKRALLAITILTIALFAASAPATADGTQAEVAAPATGEGTSSTALAPVVPEADSEDDAIGLNLDLGFASAYVFRGINVFQKDSQLDQHMLLAPGVTWAIFDTGLSIGYWGAYQISGGAISDRIDAGLGAEQDAILGYSLGLPHDLALSFGVTGYLYPWADETEAGTECPFYLEPGAGIAWAGPIDLSLKASYMLGLQGEIRDFSYLYVNPRIGKTFAFGARVKLSVGLGYGFKRWQEGNDGAGNVHDVAVDVALPIDIASGLYVTPSVHAGWTNLVDRELEDELFVYGALNVGVNL